MAVIIPMLDPEMAFDKLESLPNVTLTFSAVQLFILMSQLQLALRHPGNVGHSAIIAKDMAKLFQSIIAKDGDLATIAEMGWHSGYDSS